MKNNLKVLTIFVLFILLLIPTVKSFGINMNLISNNTNTNQNIIENNVSNINDTNLSPSATPRTVTVTNSDDEFLTVENVLSIILIVIGILLILLGIAIIIRFK